MVLGIGMGPREFNCARCGRRYSRVTCDFIVPTDLFCEECLEELGHPQQKELGELLVQWRTEASSHPDTDEGDEAPV
jgi:recombinational DNA repair protein (RecF pathway)